MDTDTKVIQTWIHNNMHKGDLHIWIHRDMDRHKGDRHGYTIIRIKVTYTYGYTVTRTDTKVTQTWTDTNMETDIQPHRQGCRHGY